jgi:hypothetical protein
MPWTWGRPQLIVELLPTEMCLHPDQVNSFSTIDDTLDYLDVKMGIRDLPGGGPEHLFIISTAMNF